MSQVTVIDSPVVPATALVKVLIQFILVKGAKRVNITIVISSFIVETSFVGDEMNCGVPVLVDIISCLLFHCGILYLSGLKY